MFIVNSNLTIISNLMLAFKLNEPPFIKLTVIVTAMKNLIALSSIIITLLRRVAALQRLSKSF